jgi:type II secretory pathway component GspD/PulD (secretin)
VDINIDAARTLTADLSLSKANTHMQGGPLVPGISTITDTITNDSVLGNSIVHKVDQSWTGASIPNADTLGVVNNLLQGMSVKKGKGTFALGETIGTYSLNAVFTALESRGIVEILANPRVATLNNVQASIDITRKIPYTQPSDSSTGNGTVSLAVVFQEAGVKIIVTPIITPNGFIRMTIELIQKIDRGQAMAATDSNPLPAHLIDERNATTNVIVPSGDTAVLGGLRQLDSTENIFAVPWLHRIPLLGWLFKNKSYNQVKTELVLMITPTMIERTPSPNDHERELYARIDSQWHKPDHFMDDVSNDDDKAKKK